MSKRNKIRYQSTPKKRVTITLTGRTYLQYRDEEAMMQVMKGDLLLYPRNDALNSTRLGEYESTGFSGYFKVDVLDGKNWQPVIIDNIFPSREHHFSKNEYPLDTASHCIEILSALAGKSLVRTYREHYTLEE